MTDPDAKMSERIPCLDLHSEGQLIRAANETALRFMAPVYLCGSALDRKDPLDIDIFLVVSERQFKRLIGGEEKDIQREWMNKEFGPCHVRRARLYMKQKEYFESFVYHQDIDFKMKTFDQFFVSKAKRLRLDELKIIGVGG